MKCLNCGNNILENSKFCQYCGVPTHKETQSQLEVQHQIQEKKSTLYILSIIFVIASCVAVFLPYASVLGVNINYINNNGKIADGIFILISGALSFIFLCFRKKVPILIFGILSILVFAYDWINMNDKLGNYSSIVNHGIGFYIILISLIGILIVSFMRISDKSSK